MDETQRAVQRLKHGDIGGLETLFARYQVRAVRTAFLILQDEAAAQHVVQDTFLRIYQRIRHFDESLPFEPYLLKSVVHAALNAARRHTKTVPFDDDLAEIQALLDGTYSLEVQIEASQLSQQILSVLAKLSPRQRAVIVQRYYLEMSEQEMSVSLRPHPERCAKPAALILSVLLALTLLTGIAYAVGRLAGFIPGFGFTGDTSTVYVLEKATQVEHDGVTLRVENAVSAEDKF